MQQQQQQQQQEDSLRARWADWNRQSGSSDCRADYFSVNQKPKIRIDLSSSSSSLSNNNVVQDHFVAVVGNHQQRQPSIVLLLVLVGLVAILVLVVNFWFNTRTGWTKNKKSCHKVDKVTKKSLPMVTANKVVGTTSEEKRLVCAQPSKTSSFPVPDLLTETITAVSVDKSTHPKAPLVRSDHFSSLPVSPGAHSQSAITNKEAPSALPGAAEKQDFSNCQISVTQERVTTALIDMPMLEQRAKEMTAAIAVTQTCLQQAGMQVEAKDLIPWIAQQQIASVQRMDNMQREARRYMFEAGQHDLNRQQSAAVQREDGRWMEGIKSGCEELVNQVERTAFQVLFIEACIQGTLWLQGVVEMASSTEGILTMVANVLCGNCREQNALESTSLSLLSLAVIPVSSCWLVCVGRSLLLFCVAYVFLQCRFVLPGILRETCTLLAMGTISCWAVSMGVVPVYWYAMILLQVLGYVLAHWQFFSIKKRLQTAFPDNNPTSHAVNQSLDGLETLRRNYAIVPVVLVAAHVVVHLAS